jgi:DNA-binding NtrC family response regulator
MSSKLNILVVDDDEALRETLADLLVPDYQVMTAASGKEAYEIVKQNSIDVVLSDVCMANGTGIELLQWIRASHGSHPAVVLITGHSQTATEEAIKIGAFAVLTKPFTRKSLIEILISVGESPISLKKVN